MSDEPVPGLDDDDDDDDIASGDDDEGVETEDE